MDRSSLHQAMQLKAMRKQGCRVLTIAPGRPGRELTAGESPGTIIGQEESLLAIACRDKVYLTPEVKPKGKKALDPASFCCGYMNICEE